MTYEKNNNQENARIEEFAENLKAIDIPQGLRKANRRRIQDALETWPAKTGKSPIWFKRRLSVPLPVAAGFLLIFFLQLGWYSFNAARTFKHSETSGVDISQMYPVDQLKNGDEPYFVEQRVYVTGIGFVEKAKQTFY